MPIRVEAQCSCTDGLKTPAQDNSAVAAANIMTAELKEIAISANRSMVDDGLKQVELFTRLRDMGVIGDEELKAALRKVKSCKCILQ